MADPVTVAVQRVQATDAFNVEGKKLAEALDIAPPAEPTGFYAKDADLRSLHWVREAGEFLKRVNAKVGAAVAPPTPVEPPPVVDAPVEQPPLNAVKPRGNVKK